MLQLYKETSPNKSFKNQQLSKAGGNTHFQKIMAVYTEDKKNEITFVMQKTISTCSSGHRDSKMYSLSSIRSLVTDVIEQNV